MDDLELPSEAEVERALFRYLAARRPVEPASVYGPLADQFGLSVTQRTAPIADNSTPEWSNRVQAAQTSLRQKGLLLETLSVWGLSDYGLKLAQSKTV